MDAGYSALVIEHFERPRNVGRFEPGPDVIEAAAGSIAQGAMFVLSARIPRRGFHGVIARQRIEAVRIQAYGCPHCIAAASWLSERLPGLGRAELSAWSWREAERALEVPAEKRGRLLILEDAARALARSPLW